MNTVNGNGIEIFDAITGEKVKLEYNEIDEKTIEVIPEAGFKNGNEYYLVINELINHKDGNKLAKTNVVKVRHKK